MSRLGVGLVAALLVALPGGAATAAVIRAGARSGADVSVPHVLVIVEENREESDVIGSAAAPYVNALAARYGVATESYGQSHPSLPNYLTLLSGSTQGVSDDGTGYRFAAPTLVQQLSERGIGWRAYMEGMPSACYSGSGGGGDYAKKHDPFMYFSGITGDAAMCANVVPFTHFAADIAAGVAPPFLWVTPNLCDDGHDCSTAVMDGWLAAHLPVVLGSSWFHQDGVVIITWDEGDSDSGCCGGAHGGHIATVVITANATGHLVEAVPLDHAGTLRSIETLYGLPYLGEAACSCSGSLLSLLPPPSAPLLNWLAAPHLR